ncbi:hypothetical protein ISN45_Aa08g030840 [Arabidopsis thaliana x Arabidopsis arenosa]|uniref:Uncharacterized protein n=1 Tax=Arabidopsis thaliana x Arabidopsis arenosa TaxID=1240361 RepID=A0A8T1XM18_9BRAS|nr:hypothetical protein ISN45_Aa08g030840 [Arabidopsis thaliana x Arabidopsis arenosa]
MCANCSGFLPLSSSIPASVSSLISSNFMIFSGKIFGANEEDDALILPLPSSLDIFSEVLFDFKDVRSSIHLLRKIIGSFCVLGNGGREEAKKVTRWWRRRSWIAIS